MISNDLLDTLPNPECSTHVYDHKCAKTVYVKTLTDIFSVTFDDMHSPAVWTGQLPGIEETSVYGIYENRDRELRHLIQQQCGDEGHYDLQHLVRLECGGDVIDEFTYLNEGEIIGLVTITITDTIKYQRQLPQSVTLNETMSCMAITFGNLRNFTLIIVKEDIDGYPLKKLKKMIKKETGSYYPKSIIDQLANDLYAEILVYQNE